MTAGTVYALVLAVLFALAAGLVGSFALSKRILLASDVLSHLALPGMGVAMLLGFTAHWILGGGVTLLLGTLLVWKLQQRAALAADAAIGVVFATSLALGALLTPKEDMLEALFGRFQALSLPEFLLGATTAVLILLLLFRLRDRLMLSLLSPELAAATGVNLPRLELYFLLLFSLTVLLALPFMGALLASALVILPAATGRRFSSSFSRFLVASTAASVVSVVVGFAIGYRLFPTRGLGPIIALVAGLLFLASLGYGAWRGASA